MDVRIFLFLISCGLAYGADSEDVNKKGENTDFNIMNSVLNICKGKTSEGFGFIIDKNNVLTVASKCKSLETSTLQKGNTCDTDKDKLVGAQKVIKATQLTLDLCILHTQEPLHGTIEICNSEQSQIEGMKVCDLKHHEQVKEPIREQQCYLRGYFASYIEPLQLSILTTSADGIQCPSPPCISHKIIRIINDYIEIKNCMSCKAMAIFHTILGQTKNIYSLSCCHIKEDEKCKSCLGTITDLTLLKLAKIDTQECHLNMKEHHFGNAIIKNNQLCGFVNQHYDLNNQECISFIDIGKNTIRTTINSIISSPITDLNQLPLTSTISLPVSR